MSPKAAQESIRQALIEEAARLLREGGRNALSARTLASFVGTSTTAVYTYFGSMDELRRAVRIEAFTRLAQAMEVVPETDDPVADAAALGAAYLGNALANPSLYRAMFLDDVFSDVEREVGTSIFEHLSGAMRRCVEAKVVARSDPEAVALEFWAATHGVASLAAAKMWSPDEALLRMTGLGRMMLMGLGVSDDDARRAIDYSAGFVTPPREPSRHRRTSSAVRRSRKQAAE